MADSKFDTLFAAGRAALLDGSHQVQFPPDEGDLRWGASVILRPDPRAVRAIEDAAREAAAVVGPAHWLPGAAATSHLTVRARLEPYRAVIPPGDEMVARYAAALDKAVCGSLGPAGPAPIRFALTGLTLTPISVMACAAPAGPEADDLAAAFAAELRAAGLPGIGRPGDIWYVNLVYFAGRVPDPGVLVDWVAARRSAAITEVRVAEIQLTRWRFTGSGMAPEPMVSIPVPPALG